MKSFKDFSFKAKLMTVILATSGTTLLLVGGSFIFNDFRFLKDSIRRDISITAELVGANSAAALAFNDTKVAAENLSALKAQPHITIAALYTREGGLFATYVRPGETPEWLPRNAAELGNRRISDRIDLWHDIIVDGDTIGSLYIQTDTGEMSSRLMQYGTIVLTVFLMATVLIYFLATRLQRLISEPIAHLAETARMVSVDNNYTVRASKYGEDELGRFIDTFNDMLAQIQNRDAELEDRVARRTAQLEAANAVISDAETRFRAVVDTANDAIVSANRDGNIIYVNRRAEFIFGYSADEMIGKPLTMLMPERFHEPHRKGLARFLATGEAHVMGKTVELSGRHIDGSEFFMELSLASWKAQGEIFFTGMIRDISTRKMVEAKMLALNKEREEHLAALQLANREMESFSYSVSHDLRAPLRAIDGFSKIIEEDYGNKFDDEGKRLFGIIRRNTRTMGQLIDDLLALARLSRQEIKAAPIDMNKLARDVFDEQVLGLSRKVELKLGNLSPVIGDAGLMRQVFANLISNAVKFTKLRETGIIEISSHPDKEQTVYKVKDNGVGFDMTYVGKLFGVFQRLHRADEFEGTGVGLAIVAKVIARHGGKVWAEGKEGEGAIFSFALPNKGGVS